MRFPTLLLGTLLSVQLPHAACALEAVSPQVSGETLRGLEALGLENLALQEDGETLTIWYENRRWFLEIEALGRVLTEASRDLAENRVIEVIPQRDRVPLTLVRVRVEDLRKYLDGTMSPDAFRHCLRIEPPPSHRPSHRLNPSLYRTDLDLTPGYFFSVDFKSWLNGTLRTPLADGLSATARGRYYLSPWGETGVTFAQLQGHGWLLPGLLGSWVAGRWDANNYGAHGEIASQLDEGNWIWKLGGGLGTGTAPLAASSVERRFHPLDLGLSGGVGVFQNGDRALFARIIRWFPRSAVDASAWRSDLGLQFRLGLSINLGASPLPPPSTLRVYPGVFSADYRASTPAAGTLPFPTADADGVWRRLSPSYIRAHVEDWR